YWHGYYEASPGPALTAAWLEIAGERVELIASPAIATVAVEHFDAADEPIEHRAARYLDHLRHGENPTAWAIAADAFVRCGVLAADSVAVTAPPPHLRPTGSGPSRGTPPAAHPSPDDPTNRLIVGVSTPVFDGIGLSILELARQADGFELDFAGAGVVARPHDGPAIDEPTLVFTAVDDRGGCYGGRMAEFAADGFGWHGRVSFAPALAPDAGRLAIAVGTENARAIVTVELDRAEE
ncbi:MAG: hypothetical protein JWO57_2177, partial [Pseudonocardiales bacterium]|nr:hypothetical protein [Pseudonocardiales bacterium]